MHKGKLFIISAASGTGKTSLISELMKALPNIELSISCTTRSPRNGEKDGTHYYFVGQEKFNDMVSHHELLEYATVFGHSYGTLRAPVEKALTNGQDVILEVDWQGAQQVRQLMPESVSIFILPPSKATLRQRISDRNEDDEEAIKIRSREAASEISHYSEYDYLIINDNFDEALTELKSIFIAERCRQAVQVGKVKTILAELMQ